MDKELQELEAELRALRPVAPARALVQRIGTELRPGPARPSAWNWLWAAALPAAAVVAVAAALVMGRDLAPSVDSPARRDAIGAGLLKPVAAENVLYAAHDEGLIVLEDGTPARRERLNYVDTYTWKNPHSNASMKWTVPREEIRFIPVNFQ